jgi:AraC-like DNA-binding protein
MSAPQSVIDFFISILRDDNLKARFQAAISSSDTPTLLKLARERGLDFSDRELQQGLKQIQDILPSPVEMENLTITEYRCTRNFLYPEDDPDNIEHISLRQGHYIRAHSEEEAWQIMARRYPDETEAGFSIQDWSKNRNKSVVVLRVERDEDGNKILIDREGKKAITNDEGDVIGYE